MNNPCGVSRCLYLLAVLANLEKNHGQAKALLEKARLIGGNEQFWHNSTFALTDAILGDDQEINEKMVSKQFIYLIEISSSTFFMYFIVEQITLLILAMNTGSPLLATAIGL